MCLYGMSRAGYNMTEGIKRARPLYIRAPTLAAVVCVRDITRTRGPVRLYNDPIIKFNGRPGGALGGWGTPSDSDTPGGSDWSETDARTRVASYAEFSADPHSRRRRMTLSFFFCYS